MTYFNSDVDMLDIMERDDADIYEDGITSAPPTQEDIEEAKKVEALSEDYLKQLEESENNEDYLPLHGGALSVHKRLTHNPRPTQAELFAIVEDYHSGDDERQSEAVKKMLGILSPYILSIINAKYHSYVAKYLDEMFAQAYEGVLQGMPSFDPSKGTPTTWFVRYINHSIQSFINSQINHSTPHYTCAAKKVFACIERKNKLKLPYTVQDIAIETGVPIKTIKKCMSIKNTVAIPIDTSEGSTGYNVPTNFDDPEKMIERKELSDQLRLLVSGGEAKDGSFISGVLTEDEATCIIMLFGLDGENRRSYTEIEQATNGRIPRHRVAKIESSALKKLKEALNSEKRKRTCHKLRITVEESISGDLLSDTDLLSDQEAVSEYLKLGILKI